MAVDDVEHAEADLAPLHSRQERPVALAHVALVDGEAILAVPDDYCDESSLVERMTAAELQAREQFVEGRIKRKLLALTRLSQGGKTRIIIADGRGEHPVADALQGSGTHIS